LKIAISTDEGNFVSPHFGRCPYFTIIEIEEGEILNKDTIENPGHRPAFLPQFLSEIGVSCIITGGMGHRARELFAEKNIEIIVGVTGKIDEVENPNIHATGGVGIRSAQFVSNKAVNTVITGNCGPNAFHTLKSANIDVITGAKGKVKNIVEQYKSGSLKTDPGPSVSPKFGL